MVIRLFASFLMLDTVRPTDRRDATRRVRSSLLAGKVQLASLLDPLFEFTKCVFEGEFFPGRSYSSFSFDGYPGKFVRTTIAVFSGRSCHTDAAQRRDSADLQLLSADSSSPYFSHRTSWSHILNHEASCLRCSPFSVL